MGLRQARVISGAAVNMWTGQETNGSGVGVVACRVADSLKMLRICGNETQIRNCLAIIRFKICPFDDTELYNSMLFALRYLAVRIAC